MSLTIPTSLTAPREGFQSFTLQHNSHLFEDRFTVLDKDSVVPKATVKTNNYAYSILRFFDLRAHYDLVSQEGEKLAHGIKQYGFSLEGIWNLSFLGWMKPGHLSDIKVWDNSGKVIGLIDGKVLTLSKARFDIQDADGTVIGIATPESDSATITVYDANNSDKILGYMKRNFVQGVKDTWTVAYSKELDPRVMLVFGAYVVQHQAIFKEDK